MKVEDEAIETDWWPIPVGPRSTTSAVGVAVSSARATAICELINRSSLECTRLEASACGLVRWCHALCPPMEHEVWGILDLGARSARVLIGIDSTPILVRAFDHGGIRWTRRIADSLQVTIEAAECLKQEHGLYIKGSARTRGLRGSDRSAPTGKLPGVTVEGRPGVSAKARSASKGNGKNLDVAAMIFASLRGDLDLLLRELERSFQYVLQLYPSRQSCRLIIVGGGAGLDQLDEFLAERMGIPVTDVEAYRDHPTFDLTRLPPGAMRSFSAALGLALPG